MGFSLKTALPAAVAASIIGMCSMLGAVTHTASTSSAPTASSQFSTDRSNPKSSTARARRDSSVSAQTTSRGSTDRSGNSEGIRNIDLLCAWPIQPRPRTATPTCFFMGAITYFFTRPEADVIGNRGSCSIPAHDARIQCWSGSSQNAIVRSSPGPAKTFRKYIGYSGFATVGPW